MTIQTLKFTKKDLDDMSGAVPGGAPTLVQPGFVPQGYKHTGHLTAFVGPRIDAMGNTVLPWAEARVNVEIWRLYVDPKLGALWDRESVQVITVDAANEVAVPGTSAGRPGARLLQTYAAMTARTLTGGGTFDSPVDFTFTYDDDTTPDAML